MLTDDQNIMTSSFQYPTAINYCRYPGTEQQPYQTRTEPTTPSDENKTSKPNQLASPPPPGSRRPALPLHIHHSPQAQANTAGPYPSVTYTWVYNQQDQAPTFNNSNTQLKRKRKS